MRSYIVYREGAPHDTVYNTVCPRGTVMANLKESAFTHEKLITGLNLSLNLSTLSAIAAEKKRLKEGGCVGSPPHFKFSVPFFSVML